MESREQKLKRILNESSPLAMFTRRHMKLLLDLGAALHNERIREASRDMNRLHDLYHKEQPSQLPCSVGIRMILREIKAMYQSYYRAAPLPLEEIEIEADQVLETLHRNILKGWYLFSNN